MKLKVGDLFLVSGQYHVEKASIEKVDKDKKYGVVYTLSNLVVMKGDLTPVNVSNPIKIEPYDESRHKVVITRYLMPHTLKKISDGWKDLDQETLCKVHEKLEKIISKYLQ